MRVGSQQFVLACFLVGLAQLGWCPSASAQAIESSAEAAVQISQQEQAFQQKQRRKLAIGWTLLGVGTGLAVSAVWLSRSGGDSSKGLKRSLGVIIPGVVLVGVGGGLLINRRVEKREHQTDLQVQLGPASVVLSGRF